MPQIDPAGLLVYGVLGLILLLTLGALFSSVRAGLKLLINAAFGVIGLLIAGVFGDLVGLDVAINPLTVGLTALLGVPGLLAVLALGLILL